MTNPSSYDSLMRQLSQKVGADPEKIRKAEQNGSVNDLLNSMNQSDAQKIRNLLSNKSDLEKLMQSPQAQALMKKLSEGK